MLIGNQVRGRLPAWLEEGLCMLVAGQGGLGDSWRVAWAGALGGLFPLARLESTLSMEGPGQALAYSQSLSVTRFYLERSFAQAGGGADPAALFARLADPEQGSSMVARFWDANWRNALEIQWRRSHVSLWRWIAALSGTTVIWMVASLLFLAAWWRKQRMARLKRERFGSEEAMDAEWGMGTGNYGEDEEM
jgi:hypothetical protein